jgi:hypothetical protein
MTRRRNHHVVMPSHFHGIVVIDAAGALLAAPSVTAMALMTISFMRI